MYIKDNEPKYYEKESNAPVGWVANRIIVRKNGEIKEIEIKDDEER